VRSRKELLNELLLPSALSPKVKQLFFGNIQEPHSSAPEPGGKSCRHRLQNVNEDSFRFHKSL
jgi:hypothetical protein